MENRSGQSQDDEIDLGVVVLGHCALADGLRGMWLDTLAMVEPINASALFLGPPRPAFTVLLGMVGHTISPSTLAQRQSRLSLGARLKIFP